VDFYLLPYTPLWRVQREIYLFYLYYTGTPRHENSNLRFRVWDRPTGLEVSIFWTSLCLPTINQSIKPNQIKPTPRTIILHDRQKKKSFGLQQTPRSLCMPTVHECVHKSHPHISTRRHTNPVYATPLYFIKIHINVIPTSCYSYVITGHFWWEMKRSWHIRPQDETKLAAEISSPRHEVTWASHNCQ
jgi:hypothetical protein